MPVDDGPEVCDNERRRRRCDGRCEMHADDVGDLSDAAGAAGAAAAVVVVVVVVDVVGDAALRL